MEYLFIASLGPVQDFIASARRTGDLYSGSWLMSEVSKSAAWAIAGIEGDLECLIFPAPPRMDDLVAGIDLRVANKIVARIAHPPAEVGLRVRQAIQKRLNDIKDEAFKNIQALNVPQANAQVEHFIEYMWVAMPLPADNTEALTWMVPAPADAVVYEDPHKSSEYGLLKQLVPVTLPEGAITDLDNSSSDQEKLWLLGFPKQGRPEKNEPPEKDKLMEGPRYWYWDTLQSWLASPAYSPERKLLANLGHSGPTRELRVHVAMDSIKGTGREGALFDTSGMEFALTKHAGAIRKLALAVVVDDQSLASAIGDQGRNIREGLGCFGSERRLVNWRKGPEKLPECPLDVEAISKQGACRVVLLTPGYFKKGYRPAYLRENYQPTSLLQPSHGVIPILKAVALQRPQVVSGWDIALHRRRPTRRLTPAGTVFFLRLEGSPENIRRWVENTWMHCISDDEQDQRDGFGLAVVGTWSGEQVESEWGTYA